MAQNFGQEIGRLSFVIPAKAGIQVRSALTEGKKDWIPAFAGMTKAGRRVFQSIFETQH